MDISVHFIGKIVIILIMWKKREKDKIGKDKTFIVGGLSRYRLWYFFARLGNKFNKHTFVRTKGKYKGKFTVHCDFSSEYYGKEICDYFKSKSKIDFLKLELKERTKEFDNFWKEKKYKSEFVEKKCENMSDKIIVISSNFKKFLDKKNLKKTTVIENWSPIVKPNNIKVKYYKKKFNPDNKFCFIYSGTLGYKHNPDLFISIAMRFPKTVQIISSKGKFANKLKKIA